MATITKLPILRLSLLDLRDQGSIAIVDNSSYSILPASSAVSFQVTPPGWPTINVAFNPGSVNVYKCGDLGITCALVNCCPLPDGIYEVTYTAPIVDPTLSIGSTTSITKTFIKIDQLECRFTNLFLKVDIEHDCGENIKCHFKKQLKEIDLLKNGAIAASNLCDDLLAYKLYSQADRYIDKIYGEMCTSCSPIPACDACM